MVFLNCSLRCFFHFGYFQTMSDYRITALGEQVTENVHGCSKFPGCCQNNSIWRFLQINEKGSIVRTSNGSGSSLFLPYERYGIAGFYGYFDRFCFSIWRGRLPRNRAMPYLTQCQKPIPQFLLLTGRKSSEIKNIFASHRAIFLYPTWLLLLFVPS